MFEGVITLTELDPANLAIALGPLGGTLPPVDPSGASKVDESPSKLEKLSTIDPPHWQKRDQPREESQKTQV